MVLNKPTCSSRGAKVPHPVEKTDNISVEDDLGDTISDRLNLNQQC